MIKQGKAMAKARETAILNITGNTFPYNSNLAVKYGWNHIAT
jgi:hypothetical protein